MGPIEILVAEDDVSSARELLLADEVEAAFDDPDTDDDASGAGTGHRRLVAILVLVCLLATTLVRILSYATG